MNFVAYGEVLWDVINGKEHLGGAPFNVAANLCRLGHSASMISRVGADPRGENAVAEMRRMSMDTRWVQTDPGHPTGYVTVDVDENGIPDYEIHRDVAYDFIEPNPAMLEGLRAMQVDAFCFGTLVQRSAKAADTLQQILDAVQCRHVIYDVNLRQDFYSQSVLERSFEAATLVKYNDEESGVLAEVLLRNPDLDEAATAEQLMQRFTLDAVCVTRGADGCTVYTDGQHCTVPGLKVEVADTVGAGDAFTAGFLATFLETGDPGASAAFANRLGAYVAGKAGATPSLKQFS